MMQWSVNAVLGVCYIKCTGSSIYAVLSVYCVRCMRYLVLTHDHWMERFREMTWFQVLRWWLRKIEMRGDVGNIHEKLKLRTISCVSQYTIPNGAGSTSDQVGTTADTRASKFNHASCTPDFSYPLISSILFPSPSPISQFPSLLHYHCRSQSLVIPLYICMPKSLVNTEYHIHRVQHTPSTAYSEYSIQWVQHILTSTVQRVKHPPRVICLPFILIIIN